MIYYKGKYHYKDPRSFFEKVRDIMNGIIRGFTLIELMIIVAIVGILAAVAIPALQGNKNDGTVCVGGFKFNPHTNQQIFGSNGGGIPCGSNDSSSNSVGSTAIAK